ncbi:hypothetical protein STCU_05178 [Strigomonas culicis]|uniref:Uncharacterized protein n=1 Tax=Strigomonas culicis TaxID=28005 RepID=S9UHX8_9TRYP|nr:hypothetical protein STCU_05178 [Strigomonas culicis]|eukprot:EPY28344.1 hypothetical protein STCU_05178 [Strigomonas culicis]
MPVADRSPLGGARQASRRATTWRAAVRRQSSTVEVGGDADGSTGLTPQDFVMPDVEDAAAVVRRIQRNVEGLNAVAREQARERRVGTGLRSADEALLRHPTDEERQLLEDWCTAYEMRARDPLQLVEVPAALRPLAGADYLGRELQRLREVGPPPAEDSERRGVEAWQEGLHSGKEDPDAARRVVATYGTAQYGRAPTALQCPTATLQGEAYQAWVREREAFFAAYTRQARGGGGAVPPPPAFVPPAVEPQLIAEPRAPSRRQPTAKQQRRPFSKDLQMELEHGAEEGATDFIHASGLRVAVTCSCHTS